MSRDKLPTKDHAPITNAVCVYHDVDLDGRCAAAIVASYCDSYDIPLKLIGANYDRLPTLEQLTEHPATVIVVDFSLPLDLARQVPDLIWIDHHKSAINDATTAGFNPPGLRDTTWAGCQLAWHYFHKRNNEPYPVTLLGRYDIWEHDDQNVLPFQYGMRAAGWTKNIRNGSWRILLDSIESIEHLIENGRIIIDYLDETHEVLAKTAQVIPTTWFLRNTPRRLYFQGLNLVGLNVPIHGSQQFKYCQQSAALLIAYTWTGSTWRISLYRGPAAPSDLDCSAIAKEYGGGGHFGAAGFTTPYLPWFGNVITGMPVQE